LLKRAEYAFRNGIWKLDAESLKFRHQCFSTGDFKILHSIIRAVFLVLFFLPACSSVDRLYVKVDARLAQQDYLEADSLIEGQKAEYGQRNAVLYYLDRAMTLHLAGRYAESNAFLEKAEARIDELYTKSVTTETGAMLTNDNLLPYEGEDFEKVMIHVIAALNYVFLDEWDGALVEARKVDHKLNLFNDRYENKSIYKEDAFARYLSGMLYEAKGELNDAFIAYRKAYETYQDYQEQYKTPLPPPLPRDLLRVTAALGLTEEHQHYRGRFPSTEWDSQKKLEQQSELIFISYDGLSPRKEDFFIDVPIPDGQKGVYILQVAFPRFVPQPTDLSHAEVHMVGTKGAVASQRTFVVEDITAIAKKNLENRIGRITAKAIARATAKYIAAREIRKKAGDDPLARLFTDVGTNIYSIVSERADKRSWRTLPGEIRMVRLSVPPGSYTVAVEYYTFDRRFIMRKTYDVTVKAGEKKFLSQRVLGSLLYIKEKSGKRRG
jgi:uncharacterized protein